jgi:hypothetical protein
MRPRVSRWGVGWGEAITVPASTSFLSIQ